MKLPSLRKGQDKLGVNSKYALKEKGMLMELEGATQVIWELVYLSHIKLCTQLVFLYNEYFLSLVGPWLYIFFINPFKDFPH